MKVICKEVTGQSALYLWVTGRKTPIKKKEHPEMFRKDKNILSSIRRHKEGKIMRGIKRGEEPRTCDVYREINHGRDRRFCFVILQLSWLHICFCICLYSDTRNQVYFAYLWTYNSQNHQQAGAILFIPLYWQRWWFCSHVFWMQLHLRRGRRDCSRFNGVL